MEGISETSVAFVSILKYHGIIIYIGHLINTKDVTS